MDRLLPFAFRHLRANPLPLCRAVLACALPLCLATTAQAAPDWMARPYDYVVLDQDLRDTLTDFGRNMGLAVSLSDRIRGRVHGRIDAATAGEFLDRIAGANGLNWYFDGSVLHISSAEEYATRVIAAPGGRTADILPELQRLGLADDRFALRTAGDAVTVSGPPAYVAMVQDFVQGRQPAPAVADHDDPRVRVFRGRIGAEDVTTPPPES